MVKGFFSFAVEKADGKRGRWGREIDETAP
jgi:hypothetical protein